MADRQRIRFPYPVHLAIGDVIDLQTLESDSPFVGMTVIDTDDGAVTIQAKLPRALADFREHPFWVPWSAVAWLRLGTTPESYTNPADDPPPTVCSHCERSLVRDCPECGHPLVELVETIPEH